MGSSDTRPAGGIVPFLITVVLFGILMPWWKGLDAFDPILLLVSIAVPVVFVTPIATQNAAGISPVARAGRAFLYSALMSLLIAFHLIATINITHWFGHILLPQIGVLSSGILATIIAEGCLAMFSVWLDAKMGPAKARTMVRVLFGALLLTYLYLFRFAPASLRTRIDEQLTSEGLTQLLLALCGIFSVAAAALAFLMQRSASRGSTV